MLMAGDITMRHEEAVRCFTSEPRDDPGTAAQGPALQPIASASALAGASPKEGRDA